MLYDLVSVRVLFEFMSTHCYWSFYLDSLRYDFFFKHLFSHPPVLDVYKRQAVFRALEEKAARWDYDYTGKLIADRKFEQLEMYTMNLLMGIDA